MRNTIHKNILTGAVMLVLVLGVYLRLTDFDGEGYTHDSFLIMAEGLAFYHDYPWDPVAMHADPPLGNILFASSCFLSDQDFSGVEKVPPYYYPSFYTHLQGPLMNAVTECNITGRVLGILGFLLFSILCFMIIRTYFSLIPIIIYGLSPYMLYWTRVIHTELAQWPLIWLGLIFAYHGYRSESIRRETASFVIACLAFGLATSAKLNSGLYVVFVFVLFLEKHKDIIISNIKSILSRGRAAVSKMVLKNLVLFAAASYVGATLIFKLNFKGLLTTMSYYQAHYPAYSGIVLSPLRLPLNIYVIFLYILSPLEIILIPVMIWMLVVYIRKLKIREMSRREKFLWVLVLFYLVAVHQAIVGDIEVFRIVLYLLPVFVGIGLMFNHIHKRMGTYKQIFTYVVLGSFLLSYVLLNVFYPIPYSIEYHNPLATPIMGSISADYQSIGGGTFSNAIHIAEVIEHDQMADDINQLEFKENETGYFPRQVTQGKIESLYGSMAEAEYRKRDHRPIPLEAMFKNNLFLPPGWRYRYVTHTEPLDIDGVNMSLLKTYTYKDVVYYYLYEIY
jgi:hypothetical protein